MRVQVNGEIQDLPEGINLDGLVARLGLAPERLAIELNREVVRRAEWPRTTLKDGDRIEIVHFVGGGSGGAEVRSQESEDRREGRRRKAVRTGVLNDLKHSSRLHSDS